MNRTVSPNGFPIIGFLYASRSQFLHQPWCYFSTIIKELKGDAIIFLDLYERDIKGFKETNQVEVIHGAHIERSYLRMKDTGKSISSGLQEPIIEPLITVQHKHLKPEKIRLGLSIMCYLATSQIKDFLYLTFATEVRKRHN